MNIWATFATIFFSMILVNNYVLVQFLGICPFLGVSKKLDSSVGMGLAVIAVMLIANGGDLSHSDLPDGRQRAGLYADDHFYPDHRGAGCSSLKSR